MLIPDVKFIFRANIGKKFLYLFLGSKYFHRPDLPNDEARSCSLRFRYFPAKMVGG
jgi:hypothetical protein